ncbi:hypothetical protein DEQ92_20345 [Haloferax sp. Atlit-6N]|uniref:hypothetical protein n=1 Tax=Haloferax sp. Atlit-6N TaxID=2077205 RepID=UPI000E266D7F|nr:hypothetical protein [Haloferax sp. Atlit-6N]REA00206.1 hypothetical protein DEQ92_20345 [Haloferax sp. Atlit-6N]
MEQAQRAKKKANEQSTRPYRLISTLCPACNRPVTMCEPNPNEYVVDDSQGEFGNDRAAFEFSPATIMDANHSNPWDAVHVVPEKVEFDTEPDQLQVIAYKHDLSDEASQAFQDALDEIRKHERRAAENTGLGEFHD